MELITFAQELFPVTLLIGIAMLIWGGNLLVESSVAIATKLGISKLVIGLTIVAFSTSSPELALNLIASINGHSDLCLGNIFGSNIANIGLVLGVGALICKLPVTGRVVKFEFPWLIAATFLVGVVTWVDSLNSLWAIVFLLLFCYLMWSWFRIGKEETSQMGTQSKEATPTVRVSMFAAWAMLLFGLLMLGLGGKATEIGAVAGALKLGMSELLVGSTVLAIATSLPEVATTIIAAKKNHPDLAVGNVIGSNIFNILLVLPITILVSPISASKDIGIYIIIMFVMTIIAYILTRINRIKLKDGGIIDPKEGGILVSLYIAFLVGISIWSLS